MSDLIQNYGDEKSPVWIIVGEPYAKDSETGYLFSSGQGYSFKKIWKLANVGCDPFICSLRPCLGATYDNATRLYMMLEEINKHKPSIIVPMCDELLTYLVPRTTQAKEHNSSLRKWSGSLLTCDAIQHPHYIIGTHPPDWVNMNWDYHEIQAFIDFGHVKEEYEFIQKNGFLQSLPQRTLLTEPPIDILLDYLRSCCGLPYVSVDIETIRPRKKSYYEAEIHHPGYPYTIAIAKNAHDAISFSFWDYIDHVHLIWRRLNELLSKTPQIGQNYFLFDSHYLEALGFYIYLAGCQDTYFRHHILWPGLEHKLQFQTKQYTREPFYKDEGKNWSSRFKRQLMIYNAKDAAVTYEIWEKQEEEFNDRPHLR